MASQIVRSAYQRAKIGGRGTTLCYFQSILNTNRYQHSKYQGTWQGTWQKRFTSKEKVKEEGYNFQTWFGNKAAATFKGLKMTNLPKVISMINSNPVIGAAALVFLTETIWKKIYGDPVVKQLQKVGTNVVEITHTTRKLAQENQQLQLENDRAHSRIDSLEATVEKLKNQQVPSPSTSFS